LNKSFNSFLILLSGLSIFPDITVPDAYYAVASGTYYVNVAVDILFPAFNQAPAVRTVNLFGTYFHKTTSCKFALSFQLAAG